MQTDFTAVKSEILKLREIILKADKAYYVDAQPIMPDSEYDKLFNKLLELEKEYPELYDPNSPASRIGSDIDNELPEKEHSVPILSLDKCYKTEDLMNWINKNSEKLEKEIEVVIEPKIDGAGVVLYYKDGKLNTALTRGNGYIGNDITENIKTIGSIPLIISDVDELAVRGEVFMKIKDFQVFNDKYAEGKYSNPRNLASGAVRRQKSKEAKLFPLEIIIYEGFYKINKFNNHLDILINLKNLGFNLSKFLGFFSNNTKDSNKIPFENSVSGRISEIPEYIEKFRELRKALEYDIDGLVVKINDLNSREELGFTQHHPRWAMAFKFDAPLAETIVISIVSQVGRGGRITPVAVLKPVLLSGSVISRATLHNQLYINSLGINIGDTVAVSKRGDVIPAVEEVIEKGNNISSFKISEDCPSCNSKLIQDGAHLFCPNDECADKLLAALQYFAGRDEMDIESLGDKTIEFLFKKGFIKYIPDIYYFDYNRLNEFEGYKKKKIDNIINSLEKSKKKDFKTVLTSMGLRDIGNKASELLVNKFKNIDNIIKCAENNDISELESIEGIGENIANSIINQFKNPKIIAIIENLKKAGLKFIIDESKDDEYKNEQFLSGTKWVITGSFNNFKPREKALELIKKHGGDIGDSISGKVTHLLCGTEPGSKLTKAKSFGINIVDEEKFLEILNNKKI